jgi:hypothetical protein
VTPGSHGDCWPLGTRTAILIVSRKVGTGRRPNRVPESNMRILGSVPEAC